MFTLLTLHYTFHCAKFQKSKADLKYEQAPFLDLKWPICPEIFFFFFFRKTINMISVYLLAPSIVQNFKKIFKWIQSYEDAPFLDPKWPVHSPRKIIFSENPIVNFAVFIHFYMQNRVRRLPINEILTIKKY